VWIGMYDACRFFLFFRGEHELGTLINVAFVFKINIAVLTLKTIYSEGFEFEIVDDNDLITLFAESFKVVID
jgi:hypothetical protein